ncbi:hypothetical protein QZH41_016393, partial [Actinostola sp. cb2023]
TTAWHYEATPINQSSTLQEELATRLMENQDRQSHALQQLVQQQQQSVTALTLPQPSLQIFNGDPVEYSDFVRAFEQLIERKTQSPSTRLYYLVQYTTVQSKDAAVECKLLNLEVFDLKQEHQIDLTNVYSMHKLPVSSADIATRQDIDRWPHLKGIELTAIDADVLLLIECDVPEALQPQDIRSSQNGGP